LKIAVVTPWFGEDLHGGAERVAWQAAYGLAERGHEVHVLTTCSKSFAANWSANFFRPGTLERDGITLSRFPVERRDAHAFNLINQKLLDTSPLKLRKGVNPVSEDEAGLFFEQSINSSELEEHLASAGSQFEAVLFMPYLYGVVVRGWRHVAERAFLQPCLHNEAYAYLPAVRDMMLGVKGLLFNSEGELAIGRHLYGPGIVPRSRVVGSAIELQLPTGGSGSTVAALGDGKSFALYMGRRAEAKNVNFLVDAFRTFKERAHSSALQLVLAGSGAGNFTDASHGILDLGYISESEKTGLLQACAVLVQPSKNESYSRTMMEAWMCGRPVIVHAECAATARAVESTRAGWAAATKEDWIGAFAAVEQSSAHDLAEVGARAGYYVRQFASWPGVLDRYEQAFVAGSNAHAAEVRIDQAVESFDYGDALAIQSLGIRNGLRALGHPSTIFSRRIDPRMESEALSEQAPDEAALLVHVRSDAQTAELYAGRKHPKALIVHGGPESLSPSLLRSSAAYDFVYASSPAVRREMTGNLKTGVLPFEPIVDAARWNIAPDATLMAALQDGRTNILSVDSIERSSGQGELLDCFARYLSLDQNARLILAGRFGFESPYYQELLGIVHGSALSQHVLITGMVSDPALAALYATAHMYVTLSEREGSGTALVEAMWFDVPVVAYRTDSTAAVLKDAGLLIADKSDALQIAALLRIVARDSSVRTALLKSQEQRRLAFDSDARAQRLSGIAADLKANVADSA
jgi:glycosyltransferase involved in cell wall biosynthesis